MRYRLWKEQFRQKAPTKESVRNLQRGLWEKILRRIKVEALKIEIWASEELEKRKNNTQNFLDSK